MNTEPRCPASYDDLKRLVGRHRRQDVLRHVSAVNAAVTLGEVAGQPAIASNDARRTFSLAGVARAALVDGDDLFLQQLELIKPA